MSLPYENQPFLRLIMRDGGYTCEEDHSVAYKCLNAMDWVWERSSVPPDLIKRIFETPRTDDGYGMDQRIPVMDYWHEQFKEVEIED